MSKATFIGTEVAEIKTIPFQQFVPLIKDVDEILIKIMDLHNSTQHNKELTKPLTERIAAANSAVSVLRNDDLHTSSHYANLQRLVKVLRNIKTFSEEITQYNTFLKSKSIESQFNSLCVEYDASIKLLMIEKISKDLCKEYDYNISSLNFADFKKFIVQEEDKAMKEDIKELLKFHLNKVLKLYEAAQHNKNITKILMERISEAYSVISTLQEREDLFTSHYTSLYRLVQVIQNMEKYIEEITQYDSVQNLRSTTIEKKFKDLREKYDDCISLLNFNLAVDFKSNAQEKDKVLLKSQAALAECMIIEIFNEGIKLYKTTQHNKNITKILIERISETYSVISILQKKKDLFTSHYYTSLQRLIQVLRDMEEYMEEITLYDTVQNSLKAKMIEKKFSNLCKECGNNINLLNFVDFKKFNAQEEDEVLKEDIRELLKFQATSVKNTIYEILNRVMKLYKAAQHDKKLTEILKERIFAAYSAVRILQERDDLFTSDYYTSHTNLHGLVYILQNMKKYIEEITQYYTEQMFLEAKTIEKKFKDLCKEYDRNISIGLLNFNLTVDFKFNGQEEDKTLLKFQAALAESMIEKILNGVTGFYKMAQHNKNIIKILKERIDAAYFAVSFLQKRVDLITSDYCTSHNILNGLVYVLQNMEKYIEEITQYDTEQMFLEAKTIEKKFKDLCKEYDSNISIGLLNFNLTVDFKFNEQEEDKTLLKFQAALAESMIEKILNGVTELYKTAQHNKNITRVLMDRISAAYSAVSILQERDYLFTSDYYNSHTNLHGLVYILQNMEKYVEEITQYDTEQMFLEAETIKEKFKDLCKEYDDSISISLLNFNLTVDFKFNVQEEDKMLLKSLVESMINKILNEVTELYKTAQHNKNITSFLIKRISAAYSAIRILQERDDLFTSDYYTSHTNLYGLVHILKNMEKYIEEITQYDTEQMFLDAKTIKEKFKDLRKEYDDGISVSLLNFNLTVDFKFNVQKEEVALAEIIIDETFNKVMELYKTAQHNKI